MVKHILMIDGWSIVCEIILKWISPTDTVKSTLIQKMT